MNRYKKKLTSLLGECPEYSPSLDREVISYVLGYYKADPDIARFFHDLASGGCISGMVNSLIYTNDCHEFYDRHYDEIEELRLQWEVQGGEHLRLRGDLKTHLAWFAFEETAWRLADEELGLVP